MTDSAHLISDSYRELNKQLHDFSVNYGANRQAERPCQFISR